MSDPTDDDRWPTDCCCPIGSPDCPCETTAEDGICECCRKNEHNGSCWDDDRETALPAP